MRVKVKYGTVRIPHLKYTVRFVPLRRDKDDPPTMTAQVKRYDFEAHICLPPRVSVTTLAHEITHVLRLIVETYHMDYLRESEHMAYLMGFLMEKAIGDR